jgi:nitroreductase
MDATQAILTRRSIRSYRAEPVPLELLTALLRAGMQAPSAGNQQPWQFVVLTDRTTLQAIPGFHPYAQMLPQAPAAILVCGDLRLERFRGYWVQDCAAATQNILLLAHALGLGAVWVGVHPHEDRVAGLQRLLGLPAPVIPLALIPLGYPAESIPPEDRFDPDRIHRERW